MKQVLWEKGCINEDDEVRYKYMATDDDGEEIEDYSLLRLIEGCLDFADEMTEMEVRGKELGATVLCTTKYHAEMAGEGIEYSWGVSKSRFRKIRISDKIRTKKEGFLQNVRQVISTDGAMSLKNVRSFSKKARSYMTLYYAIQSSLKSSAATRVR